MKNIGLFLLLATFSFNLLSQTDIIWVLDSNYVYYLDSITSDLILLSRNVFSYDANGNQTQENYYGWDSETNNWEKNIRYVIVYDVNGYCIEESGYDWDSETSDWRGSKSEVRKYDSNGNQTEYIYRDWDPKNSTWIITRKEESFWSPLSTLVSDRITNPEYIVYPNPFSDHTTIELTDACQTRSIELIDLNGRIVRNIGNVSSNSVTIYRENLPSGIYFIRIHADRIFTSKIIIR